MGQREHFHSTRVHTVDDRERESAKYEATPLCVNDGPHLGSFGDAQQGSLELDQERLGRKWATFAVPARHATRFCHSFGVESEPLIQLHASRI
jgi:hypothetical protein